VAFGGSVTSSNTIGIVSAILAFWILMSALEGLGYAFPVRPSVIVPEKWSGGAKALIWFIVIGIVASFVAPLIAGDAPRFIFFHFAILLGLLLPIWEILAARMYGDSFVILNGTEDVVRPIVLASLNKVFGDMSVKDDMLYSTEKPGQDWQIIVHPRQHLLVLDPTFKVAMRTRRELETTLDAALKSIKPAGFNERSFWISFMLPLWLAIAYGGIAFYLLRALLAASSLRGTFSFGG
jgi:hypothetical protein